MGLQGKFRISVVRTFGTSFDVGESIFWALKKSGRVLFKLSSPTNRRHSWNASDVSLSVSTGKLSRISRHGGRATKRRMFFCVWQGRLLFCEFPTGVGLWSFVKEDVRKNMGLEICYLRYVQSFGGLIGCVWKIRGLDFVSREKFYWVS